MRQPLPAERLSAQRASAETRQLEAEKAELARQLEVRDHCDVATRGGPREQSKGSSVPPWREYLGGDPGLITLAWIMDPGGQ